MIGENYEESAYVSGDEELGVQTGMVNKSMEMLKKKSAMPNSKNSEIF